MKIIFLLLFECVLFAENFSAVNIINDPFSEDEFYIGYYDDLRDSIKYKEGKDFALYNQEQETELKKHIFSKTFFSVYELGDVNKKGTLKDEFILTARKNVEMAIKKERLKENICGEECIGEEGCSVRKLMLDMAFNDNVKFDIKMPKMFLLIPNEAQYTQLANNIFGESEKSNGIKNDVINTFIDYFCLRKLYMFLDEGDNNYEFKLIKIFKKLDRSRMINFNDSVYANTPDDGQMLSLVLLPENSLEVIDDKFIEFCKNSFEKNGKFINSSEIDQDNVYKQWIDLLKVSKGKFFVGLSKIYIYCPLPNDYFEKVMSLSIGLRAEMLYKEGLLNFGIPEWVWNIISRYFE